MNDIDYRSDRIDYRTEKRSHARNALLLALAVLLAIVGGCYYFSRPDKPAAPPAVGAAAESAPGAATPGASGATGAPGDAAGAPGEAAGSAPGTPGESTELAALPPEPEAPPVLHPIEPLPPPQPLPDLSSSDKPFSEALGQAVGGKGAAFALPEELIHHIVVTVDNLPRKYLPASVVPLKRAEGSFAVDGKEESLTIAARNARRYAAFASAAKTMDAENLVKIYRTFYPLFQRAYAEIGYPQANFNDRLVTAIDDLLAAPDPQTPVRLAQPKVLYEYADPRLERRSAGQKIMMRIGKENAAVLKTKLREIRKLVAN
ncbi:MAG: DUF3014 domain-containing protein [Candidatus Accumulibacter sp.]|jgi:hypothetical protein|nr:DUF3014 domain-containing protein [Accumulibacter sp.]